jgi:ABC-type lipoprotein release transport system permease subunit
LNKVFAHWEVGSSRDPFTLAPVTLLLSVVAVIACAIPARRAACIDPVVALRD